MILGHILGGFVVKKLELTPKGMGRMLAILKPVTLLIGPLFFFAGCANRDIAGITTKYSTLNV